jgi:hypothetical protein
MPTWLDTAMNEGTVVASASPPRSRRDGGGAGAEPFATTRVHADRIEWDAAVRIGHVAASSR